MYDRILSKISYSLKKIQGSVMFYNQNEQGEKSFQIIFDESSNDSCETNSSQTEGDLTISSIINQVNKRKNVPLDSLSNIIKEKSNLIKVGCKSIAFLNNYESIFNNELKITKPRSRIVTFLQLKALSGGEGFLCSGTIIEAASSQNWNRCLIVFDNGHIQYVKPNLLFPIYDQSLFIMNMTDKNSDHKQFLAYYFKHYPDRKMIRPNIDSKINVFFNSKWNLGKCVGIDASILRIQFNEEYNNKNNVKNSEKLMLIYRGSLCLQPLYVQLIKSIQIKLTSNEPLDEFESYCLAKHKLNEIELESYSNELMSETSSTTIPFKLLNNLKSKLFKFLLFISPASNLKTQKIKNILLI
jgi:hypothetical protein